jgi:anti-anti-sigma factor
MSDACSPLPDYCAEFRVDVDHAARRLTVSGELDLATVPRMVEGAATLQGIIAGDITVDLEAVTFIDAGAFGALVCLRAQQDAQQVVLRIIDNARVARIADLCGLTALIRFTQPASPEKPATPSQRKQARRKETSKCSP